MSQFVTLHFICPMTFGGALPIIWLSCPKKDEQEETVAYQIFTDATADLNESMVQGLPDVQIIPMEFTVGDKRFTYGSGDSNVMQVQ